VRDGRKRARNQALAGVQGLVAHGRGRSVPHNTRTLTSHRSLGNDSADRSARRATSIIGT